MKSISAKGKAKFKDYHTTTSRAHEFADQPAPEKDYWGNVSETDLLPPQNRRLEPQPVEDFRWLGWVEKARDFQQ